MNESPVTLDDIVAAHERIAPHVHRTPVLTSATLDTLVGATLFFKCENLQKIGAFKARGAHNAVFALPERALQNGVVTHSSGNHAAALALAARTRGIPAYIIMPSNAPKAKVASVQRLGGQITFCEPSVLAREAGAAQILKETGATLVHPYNDNLIIAGQGTAARELLQEVEGLEAILAPVGGGGLLAGTALAATASPGVHVYGTEPAGADDARRSFLSGKLEPLGTPNTIADGLRTQLGEIPFTLIQKHVTDIVTVSDEEIIQAMRLIWEILKILIEPSSAVPVAALLQKRLPLTGKRVGIILSGGNVDLDQLPWR